MRVGATDALGSAEGVAAPLADDTPLIEAPALAHSELVDDTVRAMTVAEAGDDAELELVDSLDPFAEGIVSGVECAAPPPALARDPRPHRRRARKRARARARARTRAP